MTTRLEEMRAQCEEYHQAHPEVWRLYCRFAFELINRGFQHGSTDLIFHRIRWECQAPSYEKGKEFKLNDHFTAFYARRFMKKFPQYEGFFRTRRQISADKPATNLPPLGPEDYPTYPNGSGAVAP